MNWILYGANGYTGRLIAREAVARGLRPRLAGRNAAALAAIGAELGLPWEAFSLEPADALRKAIRGSRLVLHCAGPFSETAAPMLAACLAEGVHYLDITGEIDVFEQAFKLDEAARRADVVLAPGVGFDVVPSDCLAARLVEALPAATYLQLAFEAGGGPSPGTAKTSVEGLARGGWVRRDGQLKRVPLAWRTRTVPFAHGERHAVTIPWGDVFTAWVSTGVPDIEVYMAVSPSTSARLRRLRWLQPLLATGPMQAFMKRQVEKRVRGPDAGRREASESQLWGEAGSADGRRVTATMTTPNGYELTVTAALGVVEHLLVQDTEGGYYTPSLLMGSDYAESLRGVRFSRVS